MNSVRVPHAVIAFGIALSIFAVTSRSLARAGPNCSGTMRSVMVGDSGPPLWTPIWAPVSHSCCCTCPAHANATGTCMEVPIGAPQGGQNTLVCMCVYTDAQGTVVAVGFDYDPATGEPACDSRAVRVASNPPSTGALVSQSCAGWCAANSCKPTIDWAWTNDGKYYKDEYCECK